MVVPLFAGIGAIVCEIAPTRRLALEYGSAAVAVFLLLRVIADTTDGAAWLRWLTPLGWTEELRPFTNSQPLVLLIPIAAIAVLLVVPPVIGRNRDIGSGLITTQRRG